MKENKTAMTLCEAYVKLCEALAYGDDDNYKQARANYEQALARARDLEESRKYGFENMVDDVLTENEWGIDE